jgi:twinkle protein
MSEERRMSLGSSIGPALLDRFVKMGISEKTLKDEQVFSRQRYFPHLKKSAECACFPYFRDGKLANIRYHDLENNISMEFKAAPSFYRHDQVIGKKLVAITGSETDALALVECGFRAVASVPDLPVKEAKMEWLDSCLRDLDGAEHVILLFPKTDDGVEYEERLADKIGFHRCRRADYPEECIDACSVLSGHGPKALKDSVVHAVPFPVKGIKVFSDFSSDLEEYYAGRRMMLYSTGWPTLDRIIKIQPGAFNILTGVPSSGKSEFMDGLMVNTIREHKWKWAIYSPENMPPEFHFQKLAEKVIGKPMFGAGRMTVEESREAMTFLSHHVYMIMPEEECLSVGEIITKAKVCHYRHRINGLVIDPYNEVEHTRPEHMSETEYVSQFLSQVKYFGKAHDVIVFIVAHPKKMVKGDNGEYPVPDPYDISGCYSQDTEVLTKRGWVRHSDVSKSDLVACFDLESEILTYQRPIKVWKRMYSGEMCHFRGYSFECMVTPNHRMVVGQTWRHKKPLKNNGIGRPVKYADKWTFIRADELAKCLSVPIAAALTDAPANDPPFIHGIPLDGALRFMGWWIAEGSVSMKSLAICQAAGPMANTMSDAMRASGLQFSEAIRKSSREGEAQMWTARIYRRKHASFCDWVIANCGKNAPSKRIPSMMFDLAQEKKRMLLEALIDGDGHRPKNRPGSSRYSTTSKSLADDVMRLAIELGHHASISSQPGAKSHHLTRYSVVIGRLSRKRSDFRRERHMVLEQHNAPVYCLTVPTGAYVTRLNGEMMIAGNSAHFRNKADNAWSIWRSFSAPDDIMHVHVQKVKNKNVGRPGTVKFKWSWQTGILSDIEESKVPERKDVT